MTRRRIRPIPASKPVMGLHNNREYFSVSDHWRSRPASPGSNIVYKHVLHPRFYGNRKLDRPLDDWHNPLKFWLSTHYGAKRLINDRMRKYVRRRVALRKYGLVKNRPGNIINRLPNDLQTHIKSYF